MHKRDCAEIVLVFIMLYILEVTVQPLAAAVCTLNLTAYPYLPSGECDGKIDEKLDDWDSFPTTRCCLNGLNALTKALAIRANNSATNSLFLTKDQWLNCDGAFSSQQSVSINKCSFNELYYDNKACQNLSLTSLEAFPRVFNKVLSTCSSFDSSFDNTCHDCTAAIREMRDFLQNIDKEKDNYTLRGMCAAAVVIATVSQHINDPKWIDDFYTCLPASAEDDGKNSLRINPAIVKVCVAVLVAIMSLLLVIVLIKYVAKKKPLLKSGEGKVISAWSGLYSFSKSEIDSAINFRKHKVSLGAGSAGRVYKGILPSGQAVGIKHIYKNNTSDSFSREVEGLSRIRHPNLVCLFGCCVEDGEQYLVYEYCSNGNLAQHLLRRDATLSWETRVKILRDCANALRFLHNYPDGCIVHRDIKLTNILLTEDMDPKLSDFGLAKMLGMEESKVFTDVRGTIGYMDPEYMSNAKLTCASDVYSFGIVMLQILSGRKVIELDLDARDQLTRKAKDVIMGKRPLTDFQDPRLNGELNGEDFESILHVAVLCVAKSSKGRPSIDEVLHELEKVHKNTKAISDMKGKSAEFMSL